MTTAVTTHWLAAVLLAGAIVTIGSLPPAPVSAVSEQSWVDEMIRAVQVAKHAEGDVDGRKYGAYVNQLESVRAALLRGDLRDTYTAMNRFMDMLEARENRISPALAEWLFDFCYQVTPAQFHDVSRHIRRAMQEAGPRVVA